MIMEIKALKRLNNHENILKWLHHEVLEHKIKIYMIYMELCSGDLHKYAKESELSLTDILEVVYQSAKGLKYVHENGVVHRDIKPGNILYKTNTDGIIIFKLADFGLAFILDENEETASVDMSAAGTYKYMAPEVFNTLVKNEFYVNKGSPYAVDIYSLGIVFLHLLAPFTKEEEQKAHGKAFPKEKIKEKVEQSELHFLLISMLQKEPQNRPTASVVVDSLQQLKTLF